MSNLIFAYDWGFKDFHSGISFNDNPYVDNTPQNTNWNEGYIEAQRESALTEAANSDKLNK